MPNIVLYPLAILGVITVWLFIGGVVRGARGERSFSQMTPLQARAFATLESHFMRTLGAPRFPLKIRYPMIHTIRTMPDILLHDIIAEAPEMIYGRQGMDIVNWWLDVYESGRRRGLTPEQVWKEIFVASGRKEEIAARLKAYATQKSSKVDAPA